MTTLFPLAVYTADHGLAWNYPKSEISYTDVDQCRTAFGRLPDFDAGDPGFEGVLVTKDRVFAVRCWNVAHRDFRGRNATYLAATWVSRDEAKQIDFEALLAAPELTKPLVDFPAFFKAFATSRFQLSSQDHPRMLSDFCSVGGVLSGMASDETAVFKRMIGERSVFCRYCRPQKQAAPSPRASYPDARPQQRGREQPQPAPQPKSPLPILLAISFSLNLILVAVIIGLLCPQSVKEKIFRRQDKTLQEPQVNTITQEVVQGNLTNSPLPTTSGDTDNSKEAQEQGKTPSAQPKKTEAACTNNPANGSASVTNRLHETEDTNQTDKTSKTDSQKWKKESRQKIPSLVTNKAEMVMMDISVLVKNRG